MIYTPTLRTEHDQFLCIERRKQNKCVGSAEALDY